jgi:hypothetical protein
MITPLVCDLTGRSQTWLWLLHTFGRVEVLAAIPRRGQPLYRITRLSAGVTGGLLTATVLDEEGRRLPRIRVVRAWSAPWDAAHEHSAVNPCLGVAEGQRSSHTPRRQRASPQEGTARGPLGDDVVITNGQGLAEFPTGAADVYTLPARGRSTLWIAEAASSPSGEVVPSDTVSGIGILQSDLGLRLCLHVTWKRMCGPASRAFPPGATP